MSVASDLRAAGIDEGPADLLQRYGFEAPDFERLRRRLASGEATEGHNRIRGEVAAPGVGDVRPLPPLGSDSRKELHSRGEKDEARSVWRLGSEIDPDNRALKQALERHGK